MIFSRRRAALLLCLFGCVSSAGAVAAEAAQKPKGYLCVPNAAGDGWDCGEDTGKKPDLIWNKVAPLPDVMSAPTEAPAAPDPNAAAAAAAATASNQASIDPVTGLSLNPEDWFTPTSPRPAQPEIGVVEDLAATYYQQHEDGGFCPGGYRQRDYRYPRDAANEDYPVVALADALSTEIDVDANLAGNVTIEQGNRLIMAQRAELDYATRMVHFPDGVRMDQPGLMMQGAGASMHLDSKRADLTDVQFVLADASIRGEAEKMSQNETGDLQLSRNEFTRCEPDNNGWRLNTRRLDIEDEAVFGTAKHAVLRMKSVPVFYTPYLKFPVSDERVSGFLFPSFAYSDDDGLDVSLPYYFNLAPNYDATLIPRYISDRGAGGELELRHMSSWQTTVLSGAMLPDDDIYNGQVNREDFDDAGGEPVFGEFEPADRWLGAIDHSGRIGPFRTIVDYTSVSDRDYFRDLGSDLGVSSRRELERRGEVQYSRGGLFMRLWAQRFQRLDEVRVDDYQRVPELDVAYSLPRFGPLEINLAGRFSEFDRDTDGLSGLAAFTGRRAHLEPRARVLLSRAYGFLNLTGGYRYTSYDLDQANVPAGGVALDDSPDRKIGFGSIDGGLFFERELNWFGQDLIQTLEPRLYYLYQEFDEQSDLPLFDASELTFSYSQLYRDNRFSGIDRIGDADQVSAGVTTRFVSQASGREYFRFSIGEIFYFDDRRVTLRGEPGDDEEQSSSAVAAELSAALGASWRLVGNTVWDPHDNKLDEAGMALQYRRDNRHIFNVGFRDRFDQNVEQTDLSFYWPITRHLSVLGRWNYDLKSDRTIEGIGGVQYGDCCLQVRLMWRRFLDSPTARDFEDVEADEGIFLQIVFKGLAGFGTKVESILERGIRGYQSPDAQDYFSN